MEYNRYSIPPHPDFDNEHTRQRNYFNKEPLRGTNINTFQSLNTCTKCNKNELILDHYHHSFTCPCGYQGKFTYQMDESK